jgi:hypothetical protein
MQNLKNNTIKIKINKILRDEIEKTIIKKYPKKV